jgi:hypothetical protein
MTPLWSRVQLVNSTCILIQPLCLPAFTSASIATLVTDSLLCTPQHRSDTSHPDTAARLSTLLSVRQLVY